MWYKYISICIGKIQIFSIFKHVNAYLSRPPKKIFIDTLNVAWLFHGTVIHHNEYSNTWWRHQMETYSALLALCARNSPVTGEFPSQRPVTRSFDDFFDQLLNKQLSEKTRRRWFETLKRSLWRHCVEPSRYTQQVEGSMDLLIAVTFLTCYVCSVECPFNKTHRRC